MSNDPFWEVHPRNADLSRTFNPVSSWENFTIVERYNSPDTWWITAPPEQMAMFTPGTGSIVFRNGVQIASGRTTNIRREASTDENGKFREIMVATFASDLWPLGGRLAFSDPAHVLDTTISKFTASWDLRTGPIETLIRSYIQVNLGNLAQASRQLSRLRLPASLGRGGTTQMSARFNTLGEMIADLAEAGGLRVRTVHTEDATGTWLDLVIDQVQDLSNSIRFGAPGTLATGIIADWEWEVGIPLTTRAVVAGPGALSDREFIQVKDTAAETLWGVAMETLVDQHQIAAGSPDRLNEMTRAGQEKLKRDAGPVNIVFTPTLGPDLEFRRDVRVGDIVGYDLPGLTPSKEKIREATTYVTVVNGQPTEKTSVVLGTPDAPTKKSQREIAAAIRGLTSIQRS